MCVRAQAKQKKKCACKKFQMRNAIYCQKCLFLSHCHGMYSKGKMQKCQMLNTQDPTHSNQNPPPSPVPLSPFLHSPP